MFSIFASCTKKGEAEIARIYNQPSMFKFLSYPKQVKS